MSDDLRIILSLLFGFMIVFPLRIAIEWVYWTIQGWICDYHDHKERIRKEAEDKEREERWKNSKWNLGKFPDGKGE